MRYRWVQVRSTVSGKSLEMQMRSDAECSRYFLRMMICAASASSRDRPGQDSKMLMLISRTGTHFCCARLFSFAAFFTLAGHFTRDALFATALQLHFYFCNRKANLTK